MALNINVDLSASAMVRVIAKADDAIDRSHTDWDAYKETGDESNVALLPGKQPTIFICNFKFDAKVARLVNNAMLVGKGEDGSASLSIGTWTQTITKVSLKEIENPSGLADDQKLTLRKDGAGFVHDELLTKLEQWGVVDDIFAAYLRVTKAKTKAQDAKNS